MLIYHFLLYYKAYYTAIDFLNKIEHFFLSFRATVNITLPRFHQEVMIVEIFDGTWNQIYDKKNNLLRICYFLIILLILVLVFQLFGTCSGAGRMISLSAHCLKTFTGQGLIKARARFWHFSVVVGIYTGHNFA